MTAVAGRSQRGRIQGSEGKKVRIRQYARQVDRALRSVLAGLDLPLILASTEPVNAIFRSVNTYPHLAKGGIPGARKVGPTLSSRPPLERCWTRSTRRNSATSQICSRPEHRRTEPRPTPPRSPEPQPSEPSTRSSWTSTPSSRESSTRRPEQVTFVGADSGTTYGVFDEVARRVLINGGRLLAVRAEDVPGGGHGAAILRYRL